MNKTKLLLAATAASLAAPSVAHAQFVNGAFENGDASGWTVGGGDRRGTPNSTLTPASVLPGGALYDSGIASSHSGIVNLGTVDPTIGAAFGTTVYSGQYSWRVEDTNTGGYASAIQQKVTGYTAPNIFFAWKAVLENGGHSSDQSAAMIITLRDLTTGTDLISRLYNAGATGTGVDSRFSQQGSYYYTSQWQIENLPIDVSLSGHDFLLSILGADCLPSAHEGYVYLDGFGSVAPPPTGGAVPEPATWAMMILGFGAVGGAMRRRRVATRVRFA